MLKMAFNNTISNNGVSDACIYFVIYSCVKNLKKAELLYEMLNQKLVLNTKLYICYGNAKVSKPHLLDDKYIILNVEDDYEHLYDKTIALITFAQKQNIIGLFKCDDDILPNIKMINRLIIEITNKHNDKNPAHYLGYRVIVDKPHKSITIKNGKNEYIDIPRCSYCTGPIYYLSKTATKNITDKTIYKNIAEDVCIGVNLSLCGVFPQHFPIYSDFVKHMQATSIQNIKNRVPFLYIKINGGIGNQLFQVASGYGIAEKLGMFPIITYTNVRQMYNHNKSLNEFTHGVFYNIPSIPYDKLVAYKPEDVVVYSEMNGENCFVYNPNVVRDAKKHHLLFGYFQCEKYFIHMKRVIIDLFAMTPETRSMILEKYPKVSSSYFIHIRRGDYVDNDAYMIDYDTYFTRAIKQVLDVEPDAHFFVVSNDIGYCKSYTILDKIPNKTYLEDDTLSTMDTLYFMSLCNNGGICSNSTYSWWGSYLNPNPKKRVFFPSKWMKNFTKVDIYYENTIVVKCDA
jgi:hypothetical protein